MRLKNIIVFVGLNRTCKMMLAQIISTTSVLKWNQSLISFRFFWSFGLWIWVFWGFGGSGGWQETKLPGLDGTGYRVIAKLYDDHDSKVKTITTRVYLKICFGKGSPLGFWPQRMARRLNRSNRWKQLKKKFPETIKKPVIEHLSIFGMKTCGNRRTS